MKKTTLTLSELTGLSNHVLRIAYKNPDTNWYEFLIANTKSLMKLIYDNLDMSEIAERGLMREQTYRQKSIDFWTENLKQVT